ncbi:MAG: hypothetical protein EOO07_18835 [Chitinophagaceae bacterium]|nr:MAG: hypothetical protein EOO07_18835 [Chitinophagaceae bacterium]
MRNQETQKLQRELTKVKDLHRELVMSLEPLIKSECILSAKFFLDKIFTQAMQTADDEEIDNFSARQYAPFFLALSRTLLLMYKNREIRAINEEAIIDTDDFF